VTQIVLLLPGQGSQKVGMGRDLAEAFPAARDVYAAIDDALDMGLTRLAFDGPEPDAHARRSMRSRRCSRTRPPSGP
jgi:malonyl CoA-acyl carrier protein transacylase